MTIRWHYRVWIPGIVIACGILVTWALANEYFHVANSTLMGMALAVRMPIPPNHELVFESAVIVMAAVAIASAAAIVWMSVKKG